MKKTAILIVDFSYITTVNSFIGINAPVFILNYSYYKYYFQTLSNQPNITLVDLITSSNDINAHLGECIDINEFHQDRLYDFLNKFTDILIISGIGDTFYGAMNLPNIVRHLYSIGKNITLCGICIPKYSPSRYRIGKEAVEESKKYINNLIEIKIDDFISQSDNPKIAFELILKKVIQIAHEFIK